MSFVVAASVRGRSRDVERLALVYLVGAVVYSAVVLTRFDLGIRRGDGGSGISTTTTPMTSRRSPSRAMPLGIYFLHAGRRIAVRLFAAAGLVVLTLGFVWSGSRGGFIALAAVAVFVVLRFSAIPLRWRLFADGARRRRPARHGERSVLAADGHDRVGRRLQPHGGIGRLQIWSRGIGYMMDNPVFGVGPGNFQTAEGTLSPFAERQQYGVGVRWNAPHNSFVQIGAELGLPGLALYIAVIASAFHGLRRAGDLRTGADRLAARLRRRLVFPVARILRNALHARRARRRTAKGERASGGTRLNGDAANRSVDRVRRPRRRRTCGRRSGHATSGVRQRRASSSCRPMVKGGWRVNCKALASRSNTFVWIDPFRRRVPDRWRRRSAVIASPSHTAMSSPWPSTAHGPHGLPAANTSSRCTAAGTMPGGFSAGVALRAAIALSGGVVAVSTQLADQMSRDLLVQRSHIAMISNGVRHVRRGRRRRSATSCGSARATGCSCRSATSTR